MKSKYDSISQNKKRPSFAHTDAIHLSKNDYLQLFEWKENNREVVRNYNPVLSEGVIVIEDHIRQFFKQDGTNILYEVYMGDTIFIDVIARLLDNGQFHILHEYVNEDIMKDMNNYSLKAAVQDAITLHASLMAYMEYHSENKLYVDTQLIRKNKPNKKKRKDKNRANIVKIKQQRVYRVHVGNNINEVKDKRKIIRKAEQWTVRGHWRQLKSGRKVWIKPHTKGNGEHTQKIYKM